MIETYRRRGHLGGLMVLALLGGILAGCSKSEEPKPAAAETNVSPTVAVSTQPAAAPQNIENTQIYADLHKSFKEATLDKTPKDATRPPDETAAGKKVPELLRQICGENGTGGMWDQIRFMTLQGKRINYEAVVKTEAGEFTIELLPDAAPNHVRNFIALARAGYYDGLGVDYIVKQPDQDPELLLAGCPKATGEVGAGSTGYWLKPENSGKITHKEGTIGTWPLESEACKFYINMIDQPSMDAEYTVFGRVSKGMDVVRKISLTPQEKDQTGKETGCPKEPIIIQKVTIMEGT